MQRLSFPLYGPPPSHRGSRVLHVCRVLFDGAKIVELDVFVLFVPLNPLLHAGHDSHFVYDEGIRSEIGDLVIEVLIEAFDQRDDDDDRRDTEDDPQQS